MLDLLMWLVTLASLTATIANIYHRRWCFAVWLPTNLAWASYDLWKAAYAQAALMAIYAALSVWGLWKWGRHPACRPPAVPPPPVHPNCRCAVSASMPPDRPLVCPSHLSHKCLVGRQNWPMN